MVFELFSATKLGALSLAVSTFHSSALQVAAKPNHATATTMYRLLGPPENRFASRKVQEVKIGKTCLSFILQRIMNLRDLANKFLHLLRVSGRPPCGSPLFHFPALDATAGRFQIHRMANNLTEANFQSEVLDSDQPVLVDFWAEWCGPCKMISPLLDQLSSEIEGQAKIGKVNVDEARDLAVKYNVKSIPLLLFFKNGEVKDQIVGANVTKEQLKAKLLALV